MVSCGLGTWCKEGVFVVGDEGVKGVAGCGEADDNASNKA